MPGLANREYKSRLQVVWFDAWRHDNDESPIVALLHEIRSQFCLTDRIKRKLKEYRSLATRGALHMLDHQTKAIGLQFSKLRAEKRDWEVGNFAAELPSHILRKHLRAAIDTLLPQKRGKMAARLIVFVGDVDRCAPDVAYQLLEGLKIYLTLDNCVFVLGMNEKSVADAIGKRFQVPNDIALTQARAAAYMEKLCQNVWRLPAIGNPVNVLCELLSSPMARAWIRAALAPVRFSCLPPNPRRLKGLANLIERFWSKLPELEPVENNKLAVFQVRRLLVVAYIYQFHYDLYVRWCHEITLYNVIRNWCHGAELDYGFLKVLTRPAQRAADESGEHVVASESPMSSSYPDPTEANVFWMQPLIVDLGTEAAPEQFQTYLEKV